MREVAIVSAVRTPGGKAGKGSFYDTRPEWLGSLCVKEAVKRAEIDPAEIGDVIFGCATPEYATGGNVARSISLFSGFPVTVPAVTVNRFCASGLQAIAFGAEGIISGRCDTVMAGGIEHMSMVALGGVYRPNPDALSSPLPNQYISMGQTADNVAKRYDITRADQEVFAMNSHKKAAAAYAAERFKDELVPVPVKKTVLNEKGERVTREWIVSADEGIRPDTTLEALAKLRPAFTARGTATAGTSSQTTDGAAAVLLMDADTAAKKGIKPLGFFRGFAVAGCEPDEMGIGPVFAIPKVLKQVGLTLDDIGLIELNEAFASQSLYCIRKLGLNPDIVNVNGGAIALGHPLGATGAKLSATLLYEMKRRNVRYGLVSMCIGGGQGAAGIFELCQ
ncbi:acetyl-CoA C-acyltransferase [Eubacteriales bacterium OttesenSCG-928-K08]|nr:acetyl-CoA C-acyltransferase [Eubacteriales bacterium OttesenSCG-928-K08]